MENKNMPAYPMDNGTEGYIQAGFWPTMTGLTKREYFAAMAMQGLIASCAHPEAMGSNLASYPQIPAEAVELADELLKALEQ